MEFNERLNELKSLILAKSGIKFITPADCKRISIEISKHLNKNVSETTIKRLFGFAVVKHKFSTFTLMTLAEYVDIVDIQPEEKVTLEIARSDDWSLLKERADKLTQFTLKTIRNRSGIPYEMTIRRKFAEHDFDEFIKSDFIFTSLISQPGYGKTILLSHLAENHFYAQNAAYKNSILLFVKAYNFFNKDALNLNLDEQLRSQLQIDTKENVLDYINKVQNGHGNKFMIIIDGFAEFVLSREDKNLLFDNIINFICSLEDYKNIKLMLSMRSTMWTRFYDRMRHSSFLKSKWFPGNYFNLNELSNVPPLSEKEVDIIISKINYVDNKEINPRLKSQLKFPFHIQLYYQLKEEDPNFNYFTNITFYELVSRFIQEKIYRSNYYTEKILFLKKIIQLTLYGKNSTSVEKDSLIAELSAFRNAYMELLSDGILMEEKRLDNAHPKEYVRFLHPHMFEYFLFVEILEKFHLQVNKDFFSYINTEYDSNQVRFQLIQWATRFLIKTGNFHALKYIFKLNLNSYEVNYLILFIAEEIKYRSKYNPDIIRVLDEDKFHETIISNLMGFDFIDSCYKEAVVALIDIAKNESQLLTYYTLLGILDVIKLDKKGIAESIRKLNKLDSSKWMINPAHFFEIIYAKINGTEPAHAYLLQKLEAFKQGKNPFDIQNDHRMDAREGMCYVMLLLINVIFGDARAGIQIIDSMVKLHPKDFRKKTEFSMYMLGLYGIYHSRLTPGRKTDQIERIMRYFADKESLHVTKYLESMLLMLYAQQAYNKKQYTTAIDYAKDSLLLYRRNEVMLNSMFMYNILIRAYTELENYDLVNEYKYEMLELLDEQHISAQLFLQ
jgi:hypothetical protein